jgi:TatD DNase family protein
MQLVDIGANLTHAAFAADLPQVLERARAAGVETIVVTGTSPEETRKALGHGFWTTAGVHPHNAKDCGAGTIAALRELARDPKVLAIGECGLDFNRNYSPHPDQEKWFVAQLELAAELGKPLFLHSRDAHPRFAEILRNLRVGKAVAHCFTGGPEELRATLDLGLYVGITGWICDERRGRHLVELVKEIPADRLLLETDAPYLTPRDLHPQPRARRNEPAYLPHILRAVARARGEAPEALARITTQNAKAFFGIA